MSYIEIGQETQISTYTHKWSIAFYKPILIEITQVRENCMEKSYTEFDRNWARNVENMCKYLLTQMSEVQLSINWFWNISRVQEHCMEKSYTEWLKLGKICRKYQQIFIYICVNYSSQCPYCDENHSNSTVLYGQIIFSVLSKWGEKRTKHQHFIHALL